MNFLEKNKFVWDKYWEIWRHENILRSDIFSIDFNFNWIRKNECHIEGDLVTSLKYVHRLQQALRLCGYEEIANNFEL